MVVRLKNTTIESIEDTETRKLKILNMVCRDEGARVVLELPEVLCDTMKAKDEVNIVIDSKPIARGPNAKLYAEGKLFRIKENAGLEIVGTIGGLKLVLTISKPTASQKNTFDSDKFLLAII
ncbi:MAG: hypothetical protein ACXADO_02520 [Candidatus Thorarchaeota archaeon]|jgi:hypothetical protein